MIPEKLYYQLQAVYFFLRSFYYLGDRVECPCCGGKFREFLSFGTTNRVGAQCPRCGLLERHRLLQLFLDKKTNFFRDNLRVLDIAPTRLFQKQWHRLPNIDYLSVDITSPLAMKKADITDLPFDDNSFDCIFCYHVLEHVTDDRKAMKEMYRVLKPGGWALLQSPVDYSRDKTFDDAAITSPGEREVAFGQADHVRIYGRDYANRIRETGFIVEENRFVFGFPDDRINKYGLDKNEILYICSKK